ncbi:AraC family transcriptional regulator [Vibrio sp. ZSDE26]|uniref:AraC family transcriptional regulator n=1 Tax=Vibrio amylolyticus TaxID=2847292 RepID=A0A9X1XLP1_9VIBR|nr:AraC family transcriptional regulator [Vibrio amylolyticus]MCK6264153.1 AraC family transcriptional regulator [Vibrio amylolyticus]
MRQFTFILRIVDAIELMIPNKLEIEALSLSLNVSKWHLQHEFKRYTGMSVGHYYRARLLSLAAKEIADSHRRLIDIALDFGFDSHEAFYRAFKKQFLVSPKHLKYSPHFAQFLVVSPITLNYLEFVQHLEKNRPSLCHFDKVEVQGVSEVFPSISINEGKFMPPLRKLWSEFERATQDWQHQGRRYYTLEYRNNCSYLSGLFQMVAACDGNNEGSDRILTCVSLPARKLWQFELPDVSYVASFFHYLHLVFMPNHHLSAKVLPIIWQQQQDESLMCSIELITQQDNVLPKSIRYLSNRLVQLPTLVGQFDHHQTGSHNILKEQRLSDIVAHYMSKVGLVNDGKGAILIGQNEDGIFSPHHDYDSAYFEFSETGDDVESASYLQCKLEGTLKAIGDDLEMLYYHYLADSPFYLVRGYEWITSLISMDSENEDQEWKMELLIPAKKR